MVVCRSRCRGLAGATGEPHRTPDVPEQDRVVRRNLDSFAPPSQARRELSLNLSSRLSPTNLSCSQSERPARGRSGCSSRDLQPCGVGLRAQRLSETASAILSAVGIALTVLVLFVIVRRWLDADAPERRALRPLIIIGPPVLVVAAASLAHDYIGIDLLDRRGGTPLVRARLRGAAGRVPRRRAPHPPAPGDPRPAPRRPEPRNRVRGRRARGGGGRRPKALRSGAPLPRIEELTPRELEVLALIAEGHTDRGIAKELYVTPKTVEAHVRSIFRKLDYRGRRPRPPRARRTDFPGRAHTLNTSAAESMTFELV